VAAPIEDLRQRVQLEQQLIARLRTASLRFSDAQSERIWAIVSAHQAGLSIRMLGKRSGGVAPLHRLAAAAGAWRSRRRESAAQHRGGDGVREVRRLRVMRVVERIAADLDHLSLLPNDAHADNESNPHEAQARHRHELAEPSREPKKLSHQEQRKALAAQGVASGAGATTTVRVMPCVQKTERLSAILGSVAPKTPKFLNAFKKAFVLSIHANLVPMADEEQLKILRQGVAAWNDWREKNPEVLHPDLRGAELGGACLRNANFRDANLAGADFRGADLRGADLCWADLYKADLRGADLKGAHFTGAHLPRADLTGADLYEADLCGADLRRAHLLGTRLIKTDLRDATLTGSFVHGASVWSIKVNERTKQQNLVITDPDEPVITVDNLEVAQFIYLLLNNETIRKVIDTITSKGVLILGRFSDDRRPILNALRDAVRDKGFLPIVFDFERPTGRDFTETVKVLAGLSSFVIVDISGPRSVPLELQATVPDYMIPFVPILQEGESAFAMFVDLQTKYDWVLQTLVYDSCENLIEALDDAVIDPALAKRHELEKRKVQTAPVRRASDFRKH
jgi:uncharacterized protein YjbI with pentapeptide repeats